MRHNHFGPEYERLPRLVLFHGFVQSSKPT